MSDAAPLKVALVTPRFAVSDAYGGEVSVGLLADALTARGVRVRVIAEHVDGEDARVTRAAMTTTALTAALRDGERPDVVHVYNMNALSPARKAAERAGVPVVVTANSYWATCLFGDMDFPDGEVCPGCHVAGVKRDYATRNPATVGRRVPALLGRAVVAWRTRELAAYARIIVLSHASKRQFASAGVPAARMRVVPNMVDAAMLAREPAPLATEPHVLFVGALKHAKGPRVLVDALPALRARVPGARITLVGDGPERAALEARARERGVADAVTFAGRVPPDALPALYASARAVAFPVLWEEPFGRVTLEAWAHGVPVVVSDRGGPGEVVTDAESGLVTRANDASDLADALARVLEDDALAARLRDGGRAALARYHPDRVMDALLDAYADARGARDAPAPRPLDETL